VEKFNEYRSGRGLCFQLATGNRQLAKEKSWTLFSTGNWQWAIGKRNVVDFVFNWQLAKEMSWI
jgi:hypothetical protein